MKRGDLSPVLVNIGFGNVVSASRVIAIVTPGSSPMKRLRDDARKRGKLIDATEGRRTRSIIITDSDHVILSALQAETITQRFSEGKEVEVSPRSYAGKVEGEEA
ncbi:MAG: DUF370 domain-containing protein [Thermodesulfovibrionales bacterium]